MQLNFNVQLVSFDGPLVEAGKPITLKQMAVLALAAQLPDEHGIGGDEKFNRYQLADRISKSTEAIEVSAEEITKIKMLLGKGWGAMIVGPAYMLLEGGSTGQDHVG